MNLDHNGVPICQNGHKMLFYGYCKGRHRIKWRCPRSFTRRGLIDIPPCEGCSNSPYGRVIYTKTDWDIRLFTRIPRNSDEWKSKMKERTAAERVNDRILLDYGVENASSHGKKRISFMITLAAINVHLDAQLKVIRKRGLLSINDILCHASAA